MKWLVLLLLMPATTQASQLWLGGTRPYDTVPYRELDIEALSGIASDGASPGLRLGYGMTDAWMLLGSGQYATAQSAWVGTVSTRYRLFDPGALPLDVAAFYDADFGQDKPRHVLGLVLAKDLGDNSFAVNLEQRDFATFAFRAGYLSPFLTWTLKAGVDVQYDSLDGLWPITPQLVSQLPGDISLRLGLELGGNGRPATWMLSLSYEIFPSP